MGGDRGLSLRQCHSEHMETSCVAFVTAKLGRALARVSWAWFMCWRDLEAEEGLGPHSSLPRLSHRQGAWRLASSACVSVC